jgi:hypothetical protein
MRKSTERQSLSGADSVRLFNYVVVTQIEAQTIGQTPSSQRVAPERGTCCGAQALGFLPVPMQDEKKWDPRGARREGRPMSKKSEES